MRDFSFSTPTKVYFGSNANQNIGAELKTGGVKKVLMVTGGNSKNPALENLYSDICGHIQAHDIETIKFVGVAPNPTLAKAREGVGLAKSEAVDAVLAIGGGSVIDTAKAIAAGALYEGDVWDFYQNGVKIKDTLPIYVVLTISGTGSENNGNSVISDKESGIKKLLVSSRLYPRVAFVDPNIQETVPSHMFAACSIDAICHVMEHYFDGGESLAISDAIAEALLRTLIKEVPVVMANPKAYCARSAVMWATSLALNGVPAIIGLGGKGGDWSSHNLETGLSILKNTTHGTGLGVLFPAWLSYIKEDHVEKIAQFARNVFGVSEEDDEKAADKGIWSLKQFFVSIGCPDSLAALGVKLDELEHIAERISIFLPMGRAKRINNFDVARILQMAY